MSQELSLVGMLTGPENFGTHFLLLIPRAKKLPKQVPKFRCF